ncbi:hypothetical protein HYU89_04320 [Candidatus Collierbacteria bacterium]|nr:hypothetical protein [Candidatus Collierbacteria bacterium]
MKNKALAGLLSLIFPGLGHVYVGRYADGIGFLLGAGALWSALFLKGSYLLEMGGLRALIFWGGFLAVYLFALIDIERKVKQK